MSSDTTRTDLWQSLWPLRIVWLVVPFALGPAVASALDDRGAITTVASALAWTLWATAFVAMLVPRSVSLTVVRMIVPGALPLAAWAAVAGDDPARSAVAVTAAVLATALALVGPGVADAFVDGSSYGDERRVALKTPTTLLFGPLPVLWAVGAAAVVTGPLLLAAQRWVLGAVATAVGAAAVVGVGRRLHALSRRWLVFVPAGVVVHDHLHLSEPILFPTRSLRRLGPVEAVGDALDVTGHAVGMVLEIRPTEPVSVGARHGRRVEELEEVTSLLVAPTRPGETLVIASSRRIAVG